MLWVALLTILEVLFCRLNQSPKGFSVHYIYFQLLTFSHTLTFIIIHYCRYEALLFSMMNMYYRITCPTATTVLHNTTTTATKTDVQC